VTTVKATVTIRLANPAKLSPALMVKKGVRASSKRAETPTSTAINTCSRAATLSFSRPSITTPLESCGS